MLSLMKTLLTLISGFLVFLSFHHSLEFEYMQNMNLTPIKPTILITVFFAYEAVCYCLERYSTSTFI